MISLYPQRGASFPYGRAASYYGNGCEKSERLIALGLDEKFQGVGRKLPERVVLGWLRLAAGEH